jgi:hypothetical protein
MIWLLVLVLILWLALAVAMNLGYIEGKSKLWHWASGGSRGVLSIYLFFLFFNQYRLSMGDFMVWAHALHCAYLFNVIWWILFDILLNRSRHLPTLYVGSGSIDNSVKWLASRCNIHAEELMLLCKLAAILIYVGLYFVI